MVATVLFIEPYEAIPYNLFKESSFKYLLNIFSCPIAGEIKTHFHSLFYPLGMTTIDNVIFKVILLVQSWKFIPMTRSVWYNLPYYIFPHQKEGIASTSSSLWLWFHLFFSLLEVGCVYEAGINKSIVRRSFNLFGDFFLRIEACIHLIFTSMVLCNATRFSTMDWHVALAINGGVMTFYNWMYYYKANYSMALKILFLPTLVELFSLPSSIFHLFSIYCRN